MRVSTPKRGVALLALAGTALAMVAVALVTAAPASAVTHIGKQPGQMSFSQQSGGHDAMPTWTSATVCPAPFNDGGQASIWNTDGTLITTVGATNPNVKSAPFSSNIDFVMGQYEDFGLVNANIWYEWIVECQDPTLNTDPEQSMWVKWAPDGSWTSTQTPPNVTSTTTLAASDTNPAPGQQVTLTATVTNQDSTGPDANVAGTAEFFDGATSLGAPVPVGADGMATTQFSSTVTGPHSITAKFTPTDPDVAGSTSAPVIINVQSPTVTTTTSLSASKTNPANGEQITLTATVHANDPAGNDAVGAVEFFDGTTSLGAPVPVSGGVATTTFSSTVAGPHSLTAKFEPTDPNAFNGSTSAPVIVTVQAPAVNTTTTLAASKTNPASGEQITLTATVHAADNSNPVGAVEFFDGGVSLGAPVPVSGGTAATTFSSTVPGPHSLTATFEPTNPNAFNGSTSAPVIVTVQAPAVTTTTSLSASNTNPANGEQITLTATVHANDTAGNDAVGAVEFFDGTTSLGAPVPVSGGVATTTFSSTVAGQHSLTAKFEPTDPNVFTGSTSAPVIVTVQPKQSVATTTSLAASKTNPANGEQITLTATVHAADNSNPIGAVEFFDGNTSLGAPVPVSGGVATMLFSSTVAGQHSLTATFTPTDPNAFTGSTSAPVIVTVAPAAAVTTTTSLAASKTNPASGEQITLTATVHANDAAGNDAVGAVEFFDGTTSLGAVPVSGGTASLPFSSTVPGQHSLTATFEPTDPNAFTGSTSAPVIVTVQAPVVSTTTTLAASNTNPANGEQITLTATVHANDAAGNDAVGAVQFFDGGTSLGAPVPVSGGTATKQFSSTVTGDHSLTASFIPTDSTKFTGSTSDPVIVTVQAASTLTITTTQLPGAVSGVRYSAALQATGGTPPYNWKVTKGSLPRGLTLNATTGVISGKPIGKPGTFSFTVTVTDHAGATASRDLSIKETGD